MPTIPEFDKDAAGNSLPIAADEPKKSIDIENIDNRKRSFLREYFSNRDTFNNTVTSYNVTIQRCDSAVEYAGYTAATILSIASSIETILNNTGHPLDAAKLNYAQTAIGFGILLITLIAAKMVKPQNVKAYDSLNRQFDAAFFNRANNTDANIWNNQAQNCTDIRRFCCL